MALVLIASTSAPPASGQQLSVDEKLDFIITELEALREAVDGLSKNTTISSPSFDDLIGAAVGSALDGASDRQDAQPEGTGSEAATSKATPPIELVGWTVQEQKSEFLFGTYVRLTIEFRNVSETEISIIDGSARFTDRLGNAIGTIGLDEDLNLKPREIFSQSGTYDGDGGFGSSGLGRLLQINSNFVNVELDIRQVLFSDGSIVSFD
jgi:hypothetical protein